MKILFFLEMLLTEEDRGINYLKNLGEFQDLVSKTQVMKLPLFTNLQCLQIARINTGLPVYTGIR